MFGISTKMKRLTDKELRMNEQAAMVAASVLGQPVEAATRCEQLSTKATQMYPAGGEVWSKQVPNGTGLPKSFILAVTRTHIHALEDRQKRDELVAGRVIKSWDRAGFRAHTGSSVAMAALGHVPDDRQALMLFLPIDGDSGRVAQAIAAQRAAAGQRVPGHPYTFYIGKDAPSQRVIAAIGAQPIGAPGAGPRIAIGESANIRISPGANITVGGQRVGDVVAAQAPNPATPPPSTAPPRPSTGQRLGEIETLRATGAISDEEYAQKRRQIISEI